MEKTNKIKKKCSYQGMSEQINSMKYIDQLNDFAAKIAYE